MCPESLAIPAFLAITGCAAAGAREHDAMVASLQHLDRAASPGDDPVLAGAGGDATVLDRAALVAAVLARNPQLDVARETWRAATASYPAAVALADPRLTYETAPFSITGDVAYGQRVQLSQKLAYPGKRDLAGASLLADAEAARADYRMLRLELAEAAVQAFDDYYVATRALEVNMHHRDMVERIRNSALAQYSVGRAGQQDPLEAEAELIALDREHLTLEAEDHAAIARINRLLRRPAGATLAAPPTTLEPAAASTGPVAQEPTGAVHARIAARAAELAAADRAFYPDLELMATYDSMLGDWQHRLSVGVAIEIPLQRAGRRGSVERARAALATATAELAVMSDGLAEDRDRTHHEIDEARAAVALYQERAMPNARARIDAALAGFTAGQAPFSTVMTAERALRDVELGLERARADLDRRTAALDRLSGRIAGGAR